jgi:glycerol-3-phosphate O-acyltransferase
VLDSIIGHLASGKIITVQGKDILFDSAGAESLKFFAGMIQDYLESLLVVINAVSDIASERIPRKELVVKIRKAGIRMYHLSEIQCSESLSTINYNNAIDKLSDEAILKSQGEGKSVVINVKDKKKLAELKKTVMDYLDKVRS